MRDEKDERDIDGREERVGRVRDETDGIKRSTSSDETFMMIIAVWTGRISRVWDSRSNCLKVSDVAGQFEWHSRPLHARRFRQKVLHFRFRPRTSQDSTERHRESKQNGIRLIYGTGEVAVSNDCPSDPNHLTSPCICHNKSGPI